MASSKVHGINGLIYVSGSEISFGNAWSIKLDAEDAEIVSFGDAYKSRLRGVKDWSGSITAWHDQGTKVLQMAAVATVSVALILYPKRSDLATYYSGSALFKFGHDQDAGSIAKLTADFVGDGTLGMTGFA